jgi:hypothetical protein
MTITINTLARPLDPEVLKLEQAVNAFGQDYIPAILSFITPAKLSGLDYAPYRKDGNYADDQLGLPGNFIIEPIPDLRSKGKRIKWCNLLYSHDDNCVDLKKLDHIMMYSRQHWYHSVAVLERRNCFIWAGRCTTTCRTCGIMLDRIKRVFLIRTSYTSVCI